MRSESSLLIFDGLRQPVELRDCDHLLAHLPLVFPGWRIDRSGDTAIEPVLTLSHLDDGYRLEGYWLENPLYRDDVTAILCALVAEVMRAYARQDDRLLCLHAAAAEFGERLVVFPSQYRAGKSVLCATLAASGTRLYCDDILPLGLESGEGIAPGLAPRLRLPLPTNLAPASRRFIESHIALRGERYAYLDFERTAMAERGEQARVGAFVLLDRQQGAAATLKPIDKADVLAQVIWQNFAREAEAPAILDVLNRLVTEARCFRLCYDRAEDAVALLQTEFAAWPDEHDNADIRRARLTSKAPANADIPQGCIRQAPGIKVVEVDGNSFLADRNGAAIHQLNTIGTAIWGLLHEPTTPREITNLLLQAFPDLDPAGIRHDVNSLLDQLRNKHLLQFHDTDRWAASNASGNGAQ